MRSGQLVLQVSQKRGRFESYELMYTVNHKKRDILFLTNFG